MCVCGGGVKAGSMLMDGASVNATLIDLALLKVACLKHLMNEFLKNEPNNKMNAHLSATLKPLLES